MPDNEQPQKENKLITVTRQDLSSGYQTVQTAHAIADFAHEFPDQFKKWKQESNSIICLSVKDEQELEKFCTTLDKKEIKYVKFYEPDVNNQLTAICLEPSERARKVTSYLPLCNKKEGDINKHNTPKKNKEEVIERMKNTFQFQEQSVLQHGESVWKYYQAITDTLNGEDESGLELKIPEDIKYWRDEILNLRYTDDIVKEYCIMHDLGKPYCRTIDEEGKQHFPNHAQVSYDIYCEINDMKDLDKIRISQMILHDMDIHLLKQETFGEFITLDRRQVITHLLVGLAELLSNSQMFGGYESVGFKIKYKSFEKWTKRILKTLEL